MTTNPEHEHDFGGEFAILRVLGRGSLSTVYLAQEIALKRLVAIKVVREGHAADKTTLSRFEREARSVARLAHRNVVNIHRVAVLESGCPYIVMEYVEGQNLSDAMASGTLDVETQCLIVGQVAGALAEAHAQGIVHRDVCPGNVLWDATARRAVLTDFGIAAILDTGSNAGTRLTQAGEVLGNPQYASPEQLRGTPLTGATDIYALCVVAYELMASRGPFNVTSAAALSMAHVHEQPVPLSQLAPQLPTPVASMITQGLAKKPERRPRAADLAAIPQKLAQLREGNARSGGLFGNPALDAADHLPALTGLFRELRNRRVFNVAAVYVALTYVCLQAADLILPELPLPSWTFTALVAITLAGFPVMLVLAWTYDLTVQGVQRSEEIAPSQKGLRALRWVGFAASLVAAGLIGWWILGG